MTDKPENANENPPLPPPDAEGMPPTSNAGKVPSLDAQVRYGGGRRRGEADDEIERELQEAMGGMSAADLFAAPASQRRAASDSQLPPGKLKGRILSIRGKDVFIDVPGKRSQGVLPIDQFTEEPPVPGTEVEFTIEGNQDGLLILSRRGAAVHADWSTVSRGMIVEARVTATNKGGLAVEVNALRGFMPISQVDLYRVENPESFVNQRLRCIVTEVDVEEKNLVVSRRALMEQEREELREKTWAELAEGQVRQGVVRGIKEFGAFVDLGGVDGLLHIGELSWQRVQRVTDVVQPGQSVRVVILKIDQEKRKVSLGLRQLTQSPWDDLYDRYPLGAVVKGKVTRLADYGAFVELEPAVEGMIHISELASHRVMRVRDVIQMDQEVMVKILSIDPEQRRIALSLKAAKADELAANNPEEDEEDDYVPAPPRPRTSPLRGGLGDPG